MENTIYMTMLYDYYKNLLTDKQRAYFEDYYFNNLTLSEMAENYDVTRSAVNKQIKLTILKLEEYEEKLNLYKNGLKIKKIIESLDNKTKEKVEKLI
jgi:uncharacterized protein